MALRRSSAMRAAAAAMALLLVAGTDVGGATLEGMTTGGATATAAGGSVSVANAELMAAVTACAAALSSSPKSESGGTMGLDSSGRSDMGGDKARIMSPGGGASGMVSDMELTSMLLLSAPVEIGSGGGMRSMMFCIAFRGQYADRQDRTGRPRRRRRTYVGQLLLIRHDGRQLLRESGRVDAEARQRVHVAAAAARGLRRHHPEE